MFFISSLQNILLDMNPEMSNYILYILPYDLNLLFKSKETNRMGKLIQLVIQHVEVKDSVFIMVVNLSML